MKQNQESSSPIDGGQFYSEYGFEIVKDSGMTYMVRNKYSNHIIHHPPTVSQFQSVQKFLYDGEHYYSVGYNCIPFDVDSANLEESRIDTLRLVRWFKTISLSNYTIYFSGSKGFHIIVDASELFEVGREVTETTPTVLKTMMKDYVIPMSGCRNLDLSVYNNRALLRVPNTLNNKSGLFKIPLFPEELEFDIHKLCGMATQPRYISTNTNSETAKRSLMFGNLFDLASDLVAHRMSFREQDIAIEEIGKEIPFVEDFLHQHTLSPGKRHQVSLVLAAYFRYLGCSENEAECRLHNFISNATTDRSNLAAKLREATNDVKGCYSRRVKFSSERARRVLLEDETLF